MTPARMSIGDLASAGVLEFGDGYRTKRSEHGRPGYRIIRVADVLDDVVKLDGPDFVFEEYAGKIGAKIGQPGDILLTTKGTVGRVAVMPSSDDPVVYSPQLCFFRVIENDILNPRFLRYWFSSQEFWEQASYRMNNTDMAAYINMADIRSMKISLPSTVDQQAIVEVLGALDDKIAANTKLASTADHWVRTEYDLINRQSSEERVVGDLVSHRRKAVDPASLETAVPYVGLEHVPRRLMWLDSHGLSEDVTSNKSCFQAGDILFGKLRPYFHKVVTAPTSGICSTDILVLVSKEESFSGYVLASLTHDDVIQAVTALSAGTRMPRTNWKDLSQIAIRWPGDLAATAFSEKVQTIRESVVGLIAENEILAATRDALLPQLMSGKLRVKDVEKVVEDVL